MAAKSLGANQQGLDPASLAEVLDVLNGLAGLTIEDLRLKHGIPESGSNDFHSRVLREELRSSVASASADWLISRNSLKVARIKANGQPVEAMSFPALDLSAFLDEQWETSRLRNILDSLVVVCIRHPDEKDGKDSIGQCEVLGAVHCPPNADAWEQIHAEWREARELVRAARLDDFRPESQSRCVFVKRHGAGGESDVVQGPAGLTTPSLSFWLTKQYVKELISEMDWFDSSSDWPQSHPRVFVAPAKEKNFLLSVTASSSPEEVLPLVDDATSVHRAVARSSDLRLRFWGARGGDTNDETWANVRPGDWVFFRWEGAYRWLARVTGRPTGTQEALARAAWPAPSDAAAPFGLIYFLDGPVRLEIPAETLDDLLGAGDRQFRQVQEARLRNWVEKFGSISKGLQAICSQAPEQTPSNFSFWQSLESDSPFSDVEGETYHFDWNQMGARAGSLRLLRSSKARFVYYRTRSGDDHQCFFGAGEIVAFHRISLGKAGPPEFNVRLRAYRKFDKVVPRSEIPTLDPRHAITEITTEDFDEIVRRGIEQSPMTLATLAEATGLSEDLLDKYLRILDEGKLMLVFEGPPGTSKTYLAKALVQHLAKGDETRSRTVQFHASYAYEEFVEGIRPQIDAATQLLTFKPVQGVVMQMARMVEDSGLNHYLIVDEMNRANLPRVFGELLYLLEYRDERIQLQYSSHEVAGSIGSEESSRSGWSLPRGLKFIGTMNTADRSIRSIDAALRRRMFVVYCPPDPELLVKFYSKVNPKTGKPNSTEVPVEVLAEGLRDLNLRLESLRLGAEYKIGHTFFMPENGTLTWEYLEDTWNGQILPLIKEYLFDRPDDYKKLTLGEFWKKP